MSFYAYINPALDGRVAMAFLIGRCYKIQISYQLVIAIYIYLLYVYRIIICYYWGIVKLIYFMPCYSQNYNKAFSTMTISFMVINYKKIFLLG